VANEQDDSRQLKLITVAIGLLTAVMQWKTKSFPNREASFSHHWPVCLNARLCCGLLLPGGCPAVHSENLCPGADAVPLRAVATGQVDQQAAAFQEPIRRRPVAFPTILVAVPPPANPFYQSPGFPDRTPGQTHYVPMDRFPRS